MAIDIRESLYGQDCEFLDDSSYNVLLDVYYDYPTDTVAQLNQTIWAHELCPASIELGTIPAEGIILERRIVVHKKGISLSAAKSVYNPRGEITKRYRQATVKYSPSSDDKMDNPSTFSFEISSTTMKLSEAIKQRKFGANAPEMGNAIDVKTANGRKSVNGVNIAVPVYTIQETQTFASNFVTQAYRNKLAEYVGTVNSATFMGLSAGQVRLDGASGAPVSSLSNADWKITFRYSISRNRSGVVVAEGTPDAITVGSVKGWEYLWTYYEEKKSGTDLLLRPKGAYVAQVYEEKNLNNLYPDPPEAP